MSNRQSGTVKEFYQDKGFGLITPIGGGGDLFYVTADVQGSQILAKGQGVSFVAVRGQKGMSAIEIQVEDL